MIAFLRKEWMEMTRTGRLWILLLIFGLFGIMNPAIAKLTPWLMKVMSDSMSEAGFVIKNVKVDAMVSWTQFYKNIAMALIVFVLMWSTTFTGEYQKGTLVLAVTKGLSRWKIVFSKAVTVFATWTALYFLCFGITYGYNAYFWDNHIASHLLFGAFCYWLFGIWVMACMIFFSTIATGNTQVLLGTGGVAVASYLLGMIPRLSAFLPTKLMEGMKILQGAQTPEDYIESILITIAMIVISLAMSVTCFQKKMLG